MDENGWIELPKLPETEPFAGQRQPKTGDYVVLNIQVPKSLMGMLQYQSRMRNKSIAQIAVYLIWSGYWANLGEFIPPKKPE